MEKSPFKKRGELVWEPGCIACMTTRSSRWHAYGWYQVGELQAFGYGIMLGRFKNGTPVVVPRACAACDRKFARSGIAQHHTQTAMEEVPDAVYVVHDPIDMPESGSPSIEPRFITHDTESRSENSAPIETYVHSGPSQNNVPYVIQTSLTAFVTLYAGINIA